MTMRDVGAMPMAAMLCLVAVMLSGCISRDAAKQECKTKDGGNMFVGNILRVTGNRLRPGVASLARIGV